MVIPIRRFTISVVPLSLVLLIHRPVFPLQIISKIQQLIIIIVPTMVLAILRIIICGMLRIIGLITWQQQQRRLSMIRALLASASQRATSGTILVMAVAVVILIGILQIRGKPGVQVLQAMLYGFRLPVVVSAVQVP